MYYVDDVQEDPSVLPLLHLRYVIVYKHDETSVVFRPVHL